MLEKTKLSWQQKVSITKHQGVKELAILKMNVICNSNNHPFIHLFKNFCVFIYDLFLSTMYHCTICPQCRSFLQEAGPPVVKSGKKINLYWVFIIYKGLYELFFPPVFLTSFPIAKLTQSEITWVDPSHRQQTILQDLLSVTVSVPGSTHGNRNTPWKLSP